MTEKSRYSHSLNGSASILMVDKISKKIKHRKVINEASFEFKTGEIVGILGANGAGKTTIFYAIVGLSQVDNGNIILDGENINKTKISDRSKLGIGYLPQEASIFRKLSVEDNIMAILELNKDLSNDRRNKILDNLLGDFGIEHLRNSVGISLSGGERRRVEIARALATHPKFLFMDEPFAGIDPIAIVDLKEIIRFMKRRGIGVVITDHNVRVMMDLCDRIYVVNEGTNIFVGNPTEIMNDELVKQVYLGAGEVF